jgi:hypothetical protein
LTSTVWVPLVAPPTSSAATPPELVTSTVYVPASLMQATLEPSGIPSDQLEALALQLVVPLSGPIQLSVQAGWALLGDAVASAMTPTEPKVPIASASAAADLRMIDMTAFVPSPAKYLFERYYCKVPAQIREIA